MELVRVDDEKAAPTSQQVKRCRPTQRSPVHNKLNRTLSSASDETTLRRRGAGTTRAPCARRPSPGVPAPRLAGHTPHATGRKRFVPKRPVKENRRYSRTTTPRRISSGSGTSSRAWNFPPGGRVKSAAQDRAQVRRFTPPQRRPVRHAFRQGVSSGQRHRARWRDKPLSMSPGLAQPAAVLWTRRRSSANRFR